jgi:uncharacterized protein
LPASSTHRTVTKYRQVCDENLALEPSELAVVGLLLLRGPQTSGELRTRSERLHGFDTVAAVENTLAALAARDEPLVVRLERAAGQKEARWRQLLADESAPIAGETVAAPSRGSALAALEERVETLESRIARLEAALAELL